MKTLYKMNSTGKIQEWTICVEPDAKPHPYYEVTHGHRGGKMQVNITEIKEGKNIGKSNETTPGEQCQKDAESLWKKKRDRGGYTVEIPTSQKFSPMLAKNFHKDGKHIEFPCYSQPKLDGCVVGDTMILTKEYGYRTIKWLVDNKIDCKVASIDDQENLTYNKITYHFLNKTIDEKVMWYEIEMDTGEKLILTGNHPVYMPDLQCWRRADELKVDDNLLLQ